jgi:7-carboxy-7-deazaguanine synthase
MEEPMRIAEIFLGFDGEVNWFGQGRPSVFIRTAGCNLSCSYCDTKQFQSIQSGKEMTVPEIIEILKGIEKSFFSESHHKKVTITGGEPFLQYFELWELLSHIDNLNWGISIETNGTMPFLNCKDYQRKARPCVDSYIVDYKLPSSGMSARMMPLDSFGFLSHQDYIKFVISDSRDFKQAINFQKTIQEETDCYATFAYSPCFGKLEVSELANWLLGTDSYILGSSVLNYQLHKIWLDPTAQKNSK